MGQDSKKRAKPPLESAVGDDPRYDSKMRASYSELVNGLRRQARTPRAPRELLQKWAWTVASQRYVGGGWSGRPDSQPDTRSQAPWALRLYPAALGELDQATPRMQDI
ncbi:hypothetical protein OPT61_g9529 [Boeremia exigua]|uniref:Uncharacterized protein n=1 Tax=Boeremia exigua TaxID=749465 RepID=A0ACC2HU15_9PLEO|nr:hypothetical protein OPT61_g9529 [Boeremia exigua]